MDNRWKNALYSLLLIVALISVWRWRESNKSKTGALIVEPMKIEGETMGTTYHITYFDDRKRNFKESIDSLLVLVNKSINNYDPDSEVSRFNKSKTSFRYSSPYFFPALSKAMEVAQAAQGAFDPTVMPLVYAWGFGSKKDKPIPTKSQIDSIKGFIGFDQLDFNKDSIWKKHTKVQLDFGGIGQGYGADVMTDFLKAKGIQNMLVELGGEGMACGINLKSGKPWELGILDPNSKQDSLFFTAYIKLTDRSFTTSGNYFNYRIIDGKKYSHTIDPQTGYQAERAILSSSVFAVDARTADAWATAFMVMGHEKAIELLKQHPELEAFFVYTSSAGNIETYYTQGLKDYIELKQSRQ
ncbi:MAG: FAD:protein FMN transferase [Cyclobacteriaceae bacterium]|nr:FAD:protein FMN transferase [Cyclobacteriaceae bacterium]